ncbi:MAG: hypothetical protein KF819_06080 [Labilithrix sp.]|nr:hypothetical protein [Labilithrix sp.]
MGLLKTRWEGKHDGHAVAVYRNELTKGFALDWDGAEIARRSWSWIGLGKLSATADVDGAPVEIDVAITWGGERLNGACVVTVDGKDVPMKLVE